MTPQKTTGHHAPQTGTIELSQLPLGAEIITFGHRSGAETHMGCPRRYYLNYEYLNIGIVPNPGPLYFAVGTAVHHGFGTILLGHGIDEAVAAGHSFLVDTPAFIALDPDSQREQLVLVEGLLYAFWVYAWPSFQKNYEVLAVETGAVEYLPVQVGAENCELCDSTGLEKLPKGVMLAGELCTACQGMGVIKRYAYIAIQSRPDAILRNVRTGEIVGVSLKTIDDPSDLRRSQLVNDLQGFMELHYGERILQALASKSLTTSELREFVRQAICSIDLSAEDNQTTPLTFAHIMEDLTKDVSAKAMAARNIPTTIDYIQTIFLVKGVRKRLPDDPTVFDYTYEFDSQTDEWGGDNKQWRYRQMSALCYRYRNTEPQDRPMEVELYKTGPKKGTPKPQDNHSPDYQEESWAYRFFKPGNSSGSSLSGKWLASPIMPDEIRAWVDRLNVGEMYPSTMNDERNPHPLAKIVRFEEPLYKEGSVAAAHVKQQHERFVQITRAKEELQKTVGDANATVEDCIDALNSTFPQHLPNCRTPYRCFFHDLCHTPKGSQIDFTTVPEGYAERTPHHELERKQKGK